LPTSSDQSGRGVGAGVIRGDRLWKRFRADLRNPFLIDRLEYLRDWAKGDTSRAYRWALRDVEFEIGQGEAVGLCGSNGAGKSTLLKIVASVMYPTAGRIAVGGRIGALIEVRAGLHDDLTGRENIFLYGTLLGLRRKRVAEVFDEIVEFAQIESAVDRQVKFYSSGMQLRLGFAVAAFLEPDVLLVDEVLAVGDSAFQQRCLERMRKVLADGTTLVFVSHDLATMEATCSRGLWLRDGLLVEDGPMREVLTGYRQWVERFAEAQSTGDGPVRIVETRVSGKGGDAVRSHEPMEIDMAVESDTARTITVFLGVSEGPATPMFIARGSAPVRAGRTQVRCTIDHVPLPGGRFFLWASVFEPGSLSQQLVPWHPARQFDVTGALIEDPPRAVVRLSPIQIDQAWEFDAL
jgi:ABC-type polysaccharide/polyol phosphate transport system ATPase subunit